MPAPNRPLVLVPGACLGGWAWHDVASELRARGHEVYPVTLTGLGERVHLATPAVDLETHISDVVNLLEYEALEDAVLVGHSYAGIVVTGVADRRPERLHAVVYFDSSPFPNGMSLHDAARPQLREAQQRDAEERGDGWRWPVPDRATLETGMFGSAAGLRDEHFRMFAERGTPQPFMTFTTPLRLEHDSPPGVRRAAIFCTDGGITLELLEQLREQHDPRAMLFAAPDWELHELSTGHWAMFSEPGASAELLGRIAAG
jgi:pimeloyl-ACP methyl ester carboxylesterase